jgi:serine/threonine protein phosphatase 1
MNFSLFDALRYPKADPVFTHSHIDRLTYAIGDIHGRQDLFIQMLAKIYDDAMTFDEKPRLVLLGDYIDRGPTSSGVLESIVELKKHDWCDLVVLLGNHEYFLVKFILDCKNGARWLDYGGVATLVSYGLTPPKNRHDQSQWDQLLKDMMSAIPRAHLRMLYDAKISFSAGDYLFVHAGVTPGVPVGQQGPDSMLWIRDEFLSAEQACEYVVVHGHSIKEEPENLAWRIGVDTGAYAHGVLTAVRLVENDRQIIQVGTPS